MLLREVVKDKEFGEEGWICPKCNIGVAPNCRVCPRCNEKIHEDLDNNKKQILID